MKNAAEIMLDSGAFTVWRQGDEIDIVDYMHFIERNAEALPVYINLDQIPGSTGRAPTAHDVEMAARRSWVNYQTLTRAGFDPMPVYHYGERLYWLEKMLDTDAKIIGLGGAARTTRGGRLTNWLDKVFDILCRDGKPRKPVHGLGLTGVDVVFRYPWASVDSVSWMLAAGFGVVLMPAKPGRYDLVPSKMHISARKDGASKHVTGGRSYDSLGAREQEQVRQFFEDEGVDFEESRVDYKPRAVLNARFYKRMAEQYKPRSWQRSPSLLNKSRAAPSAPLPGIRFFYGTTGYCLEGEYDKILTAESCRHRMVSAASYMPRKLPLRLYAQYGYTPRDWKSKAVG